MRDYARCFLMSRGLAVLLLAVVLPLAQAQVATAAPATLTAEQAYEQAKSGQILLLDIRHPDEWRQTGIGEGAYPLSLHQRGFLRKLRSLTGGDMSKPIALICATGSRSRYVQGELLRRGYQNVFDVPEGMEGNGRGAGWIKRGLPVKKLSRQSTIR